MKLKILVSLAQVVIIAAAPFQEATESDLQDQNVRKIDGEYKQGYQADNIFPEEGQLKETSNEENMPRKVIAVRGSYSFRKDDGSYETVNYHADDTGFYADVNVSPARSHASSK